MPRTGKFRKERLPDPLSYCSKEGLKLSASGKWRSARCPYHNDRNPSLSICISSGGFNCHGCGSKGGDVLDFHRRRYGLSFIQAARELGAWEEPLVTEEQTKTSSRPRNTTPAQRAARQLSYPALKEGYKPEALHVYRDANGKPVYWVIRAIDPLTGKKWIRPMHMANEHFVKGLPRFERGDKPLYGLDLIAHRIEELVLLCEGEKCADALRKLGLLAVTSGGATSADQADWKPLAGRRVLIWPDHDEPGERYAANVVRRLTEIGCRTEVIDASRLGLGESEDAVDWLKAHPGGNLGAILGLTRYGTPVPAAVESTINFATTQVHNDLQTIELWCSERCVRDHRVWGGVKVLYRDFCDWCGPDYAVAPGEFVSLLCQLEIQVDDEFARGLALLNDLDGV